MWLSAARDSIAFRALGAFLFGNDKFSVFSIKIKYQKKTKWIDNQNCKEKSVEQNKYGKTIKTKEFIEKSHKKKKQQNWYHS